MGPEAAGRIDGDEALVLLLTDTCELSGRKFGEGEEFYLLKRVVLVPGGGGEVINEVAMCIKACGARTW